MVAAIIVILCCSPLEMCITFLSFVPAAIIQHDKRTANQMVCCILYDQCRLFHATVCVWGDYNDDELPLRGKDRVKVPPLVAAPLTSISCDLI